MRDESVESFWRKSDSSFHRLSLEIVRYELITMFITNIHRGGGEGAGGDGASLLDECIYLFLLRDSALLWGFSHRIVFKLNTSDLLKLTFLHEKCNKYHEFSQSLYLEESRFFVWKGLKFIKSGV